MTYAMLSSPLLKGKVGGTVLAVYTRRSPESSSVSPCSVPGSFPCAGEWNVVRVEYGVRSKCSMESCQGRMEYTPVWNLNQQNGMGGS